MREKEVQVKFCAELQQKFKEIRIFRRNVGTFRTAYDSYIKVEKKGMADLYALYPVKKDGKSALLHLEIEIKAQQGRMSKEQEEWKRFIKERGGLYVLVRPYNFDLAFERIRRYIDFLR